MLPASEPAPGSVRQKHPIISPRANGFKNFSFWLSDPSLNMHDAVGELVTLIIVLMAPSPAAISIKARA